MERKHINSVRFGKGEMAAGFSQILDDDAINGVLSQFDNESDRGITISVAAILDELLKEILWARGQHVSAKLKESLFEHTGPLSTFSGKIDICFFLGYIGADVSHDLRLVRKLRNDAAHQWNNFSLEGPGAVAKIDALRVFLRLSENDSAGYTARTKFLLTFARIAMTLNVKKDISGEMVVSGQFDKDR